MNTTPSPDDIKRLITKDDNGLLPCNSCQGKASFCCNEYMTPHGINFWKSEASCDDCENRIYGRSRISKSEAREEVLEAWNSRTYVPAIRHLLDIIEMQGEELRRIADDDASTWEGCSSRKVAKQALAQSAPYRELKEEL